MPRRAANAEPRRCSQACDGCRKRKEKCDSREPCAGCVKRGVECVFSVATARSLASMTTELEVEEHDRPTGKRRRTMQELPVHLSNETDSNEADVTSGNGGNVTVAAHPSVPFQHPHAPSSNHSDTPHGRYHSPSEAPVPQMARLLRDNRGRLIYIGDSASLSFLQNVRRIASNVVGDCSFTTDPLRHSFCEQTPTDNPPSSIHGIYSGDTDVELLLNLEQADMLANQYLTATACLLDLFDTQVLLQSLQEWIIKDTFTSGLSRPSIYLVMAIGAQATAENGWDKVAERYFARGRQLALLWYAEDPCLETVETFNLIALYQIARTRTNAAFLTIGIAVRAAYALGLHRGDIEGLFLKSERRSRERNWQSLRVLDLFLSASLGRPPATSDFEKDPSVEDPFVGEPDLSTDGTKFAYAVLRLCSLFERILSEVYKRHAVSIEIADDISRQYRQWSARLPTLPTECPLPSGPTAPTHVEIAKQVASAHLIGAYHWSIILLGRPFLMFQVTMQHQKTDRDNMMLFADALGVSTITTYSEACVDSAIRGLDVAADLIQHPNLPKCLPFVTNSVFNSALAIGVAFFGDLDRLFPLAGGMDKAEQILAHLSTFEQQACRYAQIIKYLKDAAKKYVNRRDRSSMQNLRQKKNDLFGAVNVKSMLSRLSRSPGPSREKNTSLSTTQSESNLDTETWGLTGPATAKTMMTTASARQPNFNETAALSAAVETVTPLESRPLKTVTRLQQGQFLPDQAALSTSGFPISGMNVEDSQTNFSELMLLMPDYMNSNDLQNGDFGLPWE